MKIKDEIRNIFLLTLTLGWFYSCIILILLQTIGLNDHVEHHWIIAISFSFGHAFTAAQAASIVIKE